MRTQQLHCTVLRAFLERLRFDPGPTAASGPVEVQTLAIVTRDTATLHVAGPRGAALVDRWRKA